jgi:proline racemase
MPALSGQKTVTTAGTAVQLGTADILSPITVKALDTNTGIIAIGNDGAGDVTASNGFRLAAGDQITFEYIGNLGILWIDSTVNGEGVSWIAQNA